MEAEVGTVPPSSSGSIQVSATEKGLVAIALKFLGGEGAVGSVQVITCSFFIIVWDSRQGGVTMVGALKMAPGPLMLKAAIVTSYRVFFFKSLIVKSTANPPVGL